MMRLIDVDELKYQYLPIMDGLEYVTKSDINKISIINPIKLGHWIYKHHLNGSMYEKCSNCGCTFDDAADGFDYEDNFCRHCGAKMNDVYFTDEVSNANSIEEHLISGNDAEKIIIEVFRPPVKEKIEKLKRLLDIRKSISK